MNEKKIPLKGGEFVIKNEVYNNVFIPEDFTEEQRMISDSCISFLESEVLNKLDRIDSNEDGLMSSLLEKAGELGLLSLSIPNELDGYGGSFTTSMLSTEAMGRGYSFAVAMSAHTGIGTLPILYYGTDKQKKKFIPKLATGELKASYCLTEPNAGSDANSGKTKATIDKKGNYIINGQKMWITNAGFADVFTVFAKIEDDENLSAFIIEKGTKGLSLNAEEKKMGIKGSSTRQVFFNNVKVSKNSLLGTRNEGFKIALNILNIGRIKLGGAALGGAKSAFEQSIKYALEREQFGTSISNFGAIKYKLAEQYIKIFASESSIYRCSNDIDMYINYLVDNGDTKEVATVKACEEYAIEASIIKITASEMLDYVVDEAVQIHGGMGFSSESLVERGYRDSRINRIFEGTNEINRLLIVDMLTRRNSKNKEFMYKLKSATDDIMSIPDFKLKSDDLFTELSSYINNYKELSHLVAALVLDRFKSKVKGQQEMLMDLSDILSNIYLCESTLLRVVKLKSMGLDISIESDIVTTLIYDMSFNNRKLASDILSSFMDNDELKMVLMVVKRLTKVEPVNVVKARRNIAKKLLS